MLYGVPILSIRLTVAIMSSQKINMPYVRLGKSGLKVSKIILGCMSYGNKPWREWVIDDEEMAIKHIKAAFDAGINTFDTANVYSYGESERLLGKAIKAIGVPRERFVILTKVYFLLVPDGVPREEAEKNPDAYGFSNQYGLSRKHIFDSVKASLERLQVEYIDVLQCHRFDNNTPIEETMQALHDVVKAGYVRYIGMSSCYAWQLHMMQNYAINNRLTPFISMQNYHSLLYREEEREMLAVCKLFGMGTIPWSPLSRGLLSRPRNARDDTLRSKTDPYMERLQQRDDPNNVIIDRVEEIAKKREISMAQVSLAWLMTKDPVAAPIVGTTSLEHLDDMIKSVHITLTEEEIKYLEESYTPKAVHG